MTGAKNKLSLISLFTGLSIWHLASTFSVIDPLYFPSPFVIAGRAISLFFLDGELANHTAQSLKRLLVAQLIAFPLALATALGTSTSPQFAAIIRPWINLAYPIPKLALFPVLLICLGTGDLSKIAMITLSSFFLMQFSFELGFQRVLGAETFELIKVYRVSRLKTFTQVLMRGSVPELISGIRLGFGYGLVMMVGSEMTMSRNGLGFYMWNSWDQFRLLDMYACLFWISFFGVLSYWACTWLEARALLRSYGSSSMN